MAPVLGGLGGDAGLQYTFPVQTADMTHRRKRLHTQKIEARVAAILGAVLWFVASTGARAEDRPATAAPVAVQIVAHRGSSADRPENTLASIRRAIEAGANAVEVDVRRTEDGIAVLSHDARVERTTNGRGEVDDKTLAEIESLDAGSWFDSRFAGERVPTLAQALALCGNNSDVLLDLKESSEDYYATVVEVVTTHGNPERVIMGVRSVEQAKRLRALMPRARQLGFIDDPDEIEAFAAAGVEAVRLWPKWLRDTKLVGRVRHAGLKLQLNLDSINPDEVAQLLEHRPDWLLTDDPAHLIATLATLKR